MRILVSGANGYLGRGIVKQLLDYDQEVVATDFKCDMVDDRAKKIDCNLFEVEDPFLYFNKPDVLLHLAWRDGFSHYSDSHIDDLSKHYMFLKSIACSDIGKIAVLGSMHEIGFFEGSVKEDTPCNPITPYGISKNSLRMLTQMLCAQNNKTYMWLRGFYIVSNNRHGSSVFSKIANAEAEGELEFPLTMGKNQFDFIDYDSFCEKVCRAILQNDINGIINICSGQPERLAERIERFVLENHYRIHLKYGAFPDRPYDSKAIWGDNQKINEIERVSLY